MPKVVINFRPQNFEETFPDQPFSREEQMEVFAGEIFAAVTHIILFQMKGRKEWDTTDLIMEAGYMPRINRNRLPVEVEIYASDGDHWKGIKEETEQKISEALLNILLTKGLYTKGWKGSAWILLVNGAFGNTTQAAVRTGIAAHMTSQS